MSAEQIKRRLRSGRWQAIHEGVYLLGAVPPSDHQRLMAAVLWFGPEALVSHRSAAWLWGFPDFGPCIELSVISKSHWQGRGFPVHSCADLLPKDCTKYLGFRLTRAGRTLFDIAEQCSDMQLAVAMDEALRRGQTTLGSLTRVLERACGRGQRGTERFRRVLLERLPHQASGDSPPETKMRWLIREAGLEPPVPQFEIALEQTIRVDLAFPKERVVVEVHSDKHHTGRYVARRDAKRFRALRRLGWSVLLVSPAEINLGAVDFIRDLIDALAEKGNATALVLKAKRKAA